MLLPTPWDLPWPPRRIVCHWTAGGAQASQNDRKHYHYLIDQEGAVVKGFPSLAANCGNLSSPWSHDTPDGYAAHTARFNTGSLGVSLCGMLNATEGGDPGPFPINAIQTDRLIVFLAEVCETYGLRSHPHRIMTHEEVQRLHGIQQAGKWDIRWLPTESDGLLTGDACGEWIRKKVAEMLK